MDPHDLERRIRDRAYQLWLNEGQPEGRAEVHWDMATELVAIEENQLHTLKPVENYSGISASGEPVEPLLAVENVGEFPTLTDQGEEQAYPSASSSSQPSQVRAKKHNAKESRKR